MLYPRIIACVCIFLLPTTLSAVSSSGRIEFGVSPIRHELKVDPGASKTETVKFINNSDVPYNLYLSLEDCEPDSNYGTPRCTKSSSSTVDPTKLSTWISISGPLSFTVAPKSEQSVEFTINAPANAGPGGYYGAIFFNNPDTTNGTETVSLIRRIGVLVMLEVSGDIVIDTNIGNINVISGAGGGSNSFPTSSSLLDFFNKPITKESLIDLGNIIAEELDPFTSAPSKEIKKPNDFKIDFNIPITNSGNTHIKPTGKIILEDENGFQITKVGKETIKSPEGAFIGERIVDYLPINDEAGNVLPGTERVFTTEWIGFPYETVGSDGTVVIEYKTPDEYFSQANNIFSLFPWERIRIVERDRTLNARMEVEFMGQDGKMQKLNFDRPIRLQYLEQTKGIHYGRVGLMLFFIWIIILLVRRRNRAVDARLEAALLELDARSGFGGRGSSTSPSKPVRRKPAKPPVKEENVTGTRTKKVVKKKEEGDEPRSTRSSKN